ncbi:hypothetical protein F4776DRAFT_619003 [Hypoxylon sp. NC0597]|nr:hypothetical protein F4776DRAFT_619003 [Hypoxylon sp. NC0597]
MPRRWPVDGDDDERLPTGFTRIGYDADEGVYIYRAPDGSTWKGLSGRSYGELTQITRPTPLINNTNVGRQRPSTLPRSPTLPQPTPPTPPSSTKEKPKRSKTTKLLEKSVFSLAKIAVELKERAKKKKEAKRKKEELKRQNTIRPFSKDGPNRN